MACPCMYKGQRERDEICIRENESEIDPSLVNKNDERKIMYAYMYMKQKRFLCLSCLCVPLKCSSFSSEETAYFFAYALSFVIVLLLVRPHTYDSRTIKNYFILLKVNYFDLKKASRHAKNGRARGGGGGQG